VREIVIVLGNKDTLLTIPSQRNQDIREELLKFHDRYYSSNVMALSVLGKGISGYISVPYNLFMHLPLLHAA